MRALRATPTRQPAGPAQINRANPLTRGLAFWTADPQMVGRASVPSSIGQVFAPAAPQLSIGPTFDFGTLNDVTMLSVGVINGTANAGSNQRAMRLGGTSARFEGFTSNAQVAANITYSDFTSTAISPIAHGVSTARGVLALCLRHIRNDSAGVALFANGRVLSSVASQNKSLVPGTLQAIVHEADTGGMQGFLTAFNGFWTRALSDAEIASLSANPWQMFQSPRRLGWVFEAGGVTVYRPGSDVIVNGWTATPGGSLASCIDDPTLDRADYITSPNLTNSVTLAWAAPLPAGTYDLSIDADRTGASGQVRVVCLDAGGTSVGATAWQALTGTAATHTLSVTTTATSTQFRIEVQS